MSDRLHKPRSGLARVEERIVAACAEAERDPRDVLLVVVTKTFPASDVRLLAEPGVTDVARNKQQELADKLAELGTFRCAGTRGAPAEQQGGAVAADADVVHGRPVSCRRMDRRQRRSTSCSRSVSTPPAATTARGRRHQLDELAEAVLGQTTCC